MKFCTVATNRILHKCIKFHRSIARKLASVRLPAVHQCKSKFQICVDITLTYNIPFTVLDVNIEVNTRFSENVHLCIVVSPGHEVHFTALLVIWEPESVNETDAVKMPHRIPRDFS